MAYEIWKYPIDHRRKRLEFAIPRGSKFLAVQLQYERPVMWWLVDTAAEKSQHVFHIYQTGAQIDGNPGRYLGTYQLSNGSFVHHLFEDLYN
jgi:hypothetical protein